MPSYVGSIARPPKTLTEQEQATLLRVTGEHRDGFRDHVILSLALGSGLREHEIAALNVGDILHDDGHIRRRIVLRVFKRASAEPAPQEIIVADSTWYKLTKFIAWKRGRGEGVGAASPLFVSRRGLRIATRTIRHMFRVWQKRAGLDRLVGFHSARHSACTNLYRRTRDLRMVQRFARHKSVTTTQIYTAPSDEDLLNAIREQPC
jgi:integrase/recombinase XerC